MFAGTEMTWSALAAKSAYDLRFACAHERDSIVVTYATNPDGTPKPVWWTFDLWQRLADTVVAVDRAADGGRPGDDLFVVATTARDRVVILVASFRGDPSSTAPHHLTLDLAGLPSDPTAATVRRLDYAHPTATATAPVAVDDRRIALDLPVPGVVLVEVQISA